MPFGFLFLIVGVVYMPLWIQVDLYRQEELNADMLSQSFKEVVYITLHVGLLYETPLRIVLSIIFTNIRVFASRNFMSQYLQLPVPRLSRETRRLFHLRKACYAC